MMLIDRLILRGFYKAWVICFLTLVSLYLVIDLFNRVDEFATGSGGTAAGFARAVAIFYSAQIVLIFDRLCGVIVLLAAMFTVAWMQRNNELVPFLSAGVPCRRLLRPVFVGTVSMVLLSVANRELVMPRIADDLQRSASDPNGVRSRLVSAAYEPNGILIAGQSAIASKMTVDGFSCTVPEKIAGSLLHIKARTARYIPRGPKQPSGGWLLTETSPTDLPRWEDPVIEVLDPGKFFLHTERVDFETLLRTRNWHQFASTFELFDELQRPEATRLSALAVQMHLRFTVPVLTVIMVLMGLGVILRDQNRGVFLNAGLCVVLAAVFFGTCQLFRHLGEQEYLSPTLAAWMPVLFYGPTSVAMFDAIHT